MNKTLTQTFGVLILLTVATAILSKQNSSMFWPAAIIMLLSALKFSLVTFQFMELKLAHSAWKVVLLLLLSLIILVVISSVFIAAR